FFFFFSSRRRHTRFSRDWSSDVCSSDLAANGRSRGQSRRTPTSSAWSRSLSSGLYRRLRSHTGSADLRLSEALAGLASLPYRRRSEERRVGKEWRARWSTHHETHEE